jgi:hypothetical protein
MEMEGKSHLPFLDIDVYRDQMAPVAIGCTENPCVQIYIYTRCHIIIDLKTCCI